MMVDNGMETIRDPVEDLYRIHRQQMWHEIGALYLTMRLNVFHLHDDLRKKKKQ